MTKFLSIEQVSRDPWISGRIALKEQEGYVFLRKRTYPLAVFLWCSGIFCGMYYWVTPHINDEPIIMAGFYFLCPLLVAIFTLIAWWIDRKPPILVYDSSREALIIPRYSDHEVPREGTTIRVIPTRVKAEDTTYCQILTIYSKNEEIAIFCEQSGALKKPAKKFAERTGIKLEVLALQK